MYDRPRPNQAESGSMLLTAYVLATIALAVPAAALVGAEGLMMAAAFTSACMVAAAWRRHCYGLVMPMAAASIFAALAGLLIYLASR